MTTTQMLNYKQLPGMLPMLARAGITRKPAVDNPEYPQLAARIDAVRVEKQKLQRYNQVCGFADNDTLPPTYPHIMAFRLHMAMLLQNSFPFSPMGLIHLRNSITQYRAIPATETLALSCRLGGNRVAEKGFEFDIHSEARIADDIVWESQSVLMARRPVAGGQNRTPPPLPDYPQRKAWRLDSNSGRQYARASGDYNPIHLYPVTAKLLGFKRHIIHGMWSKARCVAELYPKLGQHSCRMEVEFKTPIFLPAEVNFNYQPPTQDEAAFLFDLRDEANTKPHLAGRISGL